MVSQIPVELLYLCFSFLLTAFLITAGTPLAERLGLMDDPDHRKRHDAPIPLVGGAMMFLALFALSLVLLPVTTTLLYLLAAGGLLMMVGLYDDRFSMVYWLRLLAHISAGLILVFGVGDTLNSFGALLPGLGEIQLGWLAVPMTVLGVVAVVNAFNLIDGMDGLAAGLALVAILGLLLLLHGRISLASEIILMFMAGALLAYLMFNLHLFPALTRKVFMGDAGATFVGFVLVAFLIRYSQFSPDTSRVFQPVTALWLVAVPLTDMVITFSRRVRRGQSPFHADRTHIHHIFVRAGFRKETVLAIIVLWAMLLALVGVGLHYLGVADWLSFVLFLLACGVHVWVVGRAWQISKWFHRHRKRR